MSRYLRIGLLASVLAFSFVTSSCSNSDNANDAELEKIKQELAELKEEIASEPSAEAIEETQQPNADDAAFQSAKSDGRVSAFGKYAKEFGDGQHIEAADEGAWESAKRQNSVLAFRAYQRYFPEGKYVRESYVSTYKVQTKASEKAMGELGFNISEFPTFTIGSIDSAGNVELASRDKAELERIASAKAERARNEKASLALVEEERRQEFARQEVLRLEKIREESLRAEALRQEQQKLREKQQLMGCASGDDCLNKGRQYISQKDYQRAIVLLQKACNFDNMMGCQLLAVTIEDAPGVTRDPDRTLKLFKKACFGGVSSGCFNAGLTYRDGLNYMPRDKGKAKAYFEKSCSLGDQYACRIVNSL